MSETPNMNYDIDALFDHMINNLNHDPANELDWSFSLRSSDLNTLEAAAKEFEQEFVVQLEESVEEIDTDGNTSLGGPLLNIIQRDALTADEVKTLAEKISAIATERGLVYEGVSCYDPIDEDEIYGWLTPDDAGLRLSHMTEAGLEINEEIPRCFLILSPDADGMKKIVDELETIGFNDRDDYEEPDEDGTFVVCIFVTGRNNEAELREASTKITQVVESHGGKLEGVQYYTREEMHEVFGIEIAE